MTCKLVNSKDRDIIPMCDLPKGKLGVIVDPYSSWYGEIVMKDSASYFTVLGKQVCRIFNTTCEIKVHVLEEGELIEVKYS